MHVGEFKKHLYKFTGRGVKMGPPDTGDIILFNISHY